MAALPKRLFDRSFSVTVLLHLVLHADLQVIVQVFADAGEIVDRRDAASGEERGGTDARKLQQLGRADAARRKNRFPARLRETRGHLSDG